MAYHSPRLLLFDQNNSKNEEIEILQSKITCNILKLNIAVNKAEFSASLLQSSVSHDDPYDDLI